VSRASKDWGWATPLDSIAGQVAIAGVGESPASARSDRNAVDMAGEAIEAAIADAGLTPAEVDGLMLQKGMGGQFSAEAFHARFGTSHDLWVSDAGGAMTWAGTAPYQAAEALRTGRARHILNVFSVDWGSQKAAGTGGPGDYHAQERMKAGFELPFGYYPQPVYFAGVARRHMHQYGTTEAQLGAIAVALRAHANGHPGAVMRDKTLTLEQYLARPMLVDPLRMEDFCLISDGAAAYLMTTPERARDLARPPVIVQGVGEGVSAAGTYFSQQGDFTATPQVFAAPAAFAMAGLSPKDVDVLAVYDPFTIVALMQIEDMGFCAKGEGGPFVEGDRLSHKRGRAKGGLPFNTHGGLLSHAYLLGIAHVVELVRQLRGEAANQVADARVAAFGGFTGGDASTLLMVRA
jgi:acetyl-CoA acetyltransferase